VKDMPRISKAKNDDVAGNSPSQNMDNLSVSDNSVSDTVSVSNSNSTNSSNNVPMSSVVSSQVISSADGVSDMTGTKRQSQSNQSMQRPYNNNRSYNGNGQSNSYGSRSAGFDSNRNGRNGYNNYDSRGGNGSNGQNGYSSNSNGYNSAPVQSGDEFSGSFAGDTVPVQGMLEILPDYGVIRQPEQLDETLPKDVYTSLSQIRRFGLRTGDIVTGQARPPKDSERWLSLLKVEKVNGFDPDKAKQRPHFSRLTPIFPDEWMKLETEPNILSTRLIDLVSPIGKGQRAMIVAPPKAGKTWLLQDIAAGIAQNHPNITLMVCLIGERPEEVTDMKRKVKGEVFASNFDEPSDVQTRVAELTLEKAKRLVEKGEDVVILMDSLTRLARAYNLVVEPSGRTLSGGFDPSALYPPKHFFGAARNVENGGSLTIIATALVETGSRMDDVIFEEFKGTGNMELRLDRSLAERRIYPSIDIKASSTRNEDKLYEKDTYDAVILLRRMIDLLNDNEITEMVINRMKKSKTNAEFLKNLREGGK
jgi:transcription termination factor Rho